MPKNKRFALLAAVLLGAGLSFAAAGPTSAHDLPSLTIGDRVVDEVAGMVMLTVSLYPDSDQTVTVDYTTVDGTAVAPGDYASTSGTLSFSPGSTTRNIFVPLVDDSVDEPDETFTVVLSSAEAAWINGGVATVTIGDQSRDGTFFCTATAVNLLGAKTAEANPAGTPCTDATVGAPSLNRTVGVITIGATALSASTDQVPDLLIPAPAGGDGATGSARVGSARIAVGLTTIELGLIVSEARVTCVVTPSGLQPRLSGSSTVSSLKVNGVSIPVGSGPLTVPLLFGSLKLNATVTTGNRVTQQAAVLEVLGSGLVVLGEAKAGFDGSAAHPAGNPCLA